MAFNGDEGDVWKCPKHPSKRRRTGVCHLCLRDRLVSLCPDCANLRPCACCASAATSSSSSSSSSLSRFSAADRVSSLIDSEPAFRRSRSVAALPFLRSRSRFVADRDGDGGDCSSSSRGGARAAAASFWSLFRPRKSKKSHDAGRVEAAEGEFRLRSAKEVAEVEEAMRRTMMIRSRSVAAVSDSSGKFARPQPAKARGWYFPSPIKVFRQPKIPKAVMTERSPLHRG